MTNQQPPQFIGIDLAHGADWTLTQRIYVAGPMTGYEDLNFPAFHAEADLLRLAGHTVINPAEINSDPTAQWLDCMRADIKQLVDCDRIHLLPGWSRSRGATLEHHIAKALGLVITLAEGAEAGPESFYVESGRQVGKSLLLERWKDITNTLKKNEVHTSDYFAYQYLTHATTSNKPGSQTADAADPGGNNNTAPDAVTKVSPTAAIDICQHIADHHNEQLREALQTHGYHNAVTKAHGYQYLGAQRCVEALRIAAREGV